MLIISSGSQPAGLDAVPDECPEGYKIIAKVVYRACPPSSGTRKMKGRIFPSFPEDDPDQDPYDVPLLIESDGQSQNHALYFSPSPSQQAPSPPPTPEELEEDERDEELELRPLIRARARAQAKGKKGTRSASRAGTVIAVKTFVLSRYEDDDDVQAIRDEKRRTAPQPFETLCDWILTIADITSKRKVREHARSSSPPPSDIKDKVVSNKVFQELFNRGKDYLPLCRDTAPLILRLKDEYPHVYNYQVKKNNNYGADSLKTVLESKLKQLDKDKRKRKRAADEAEARILRRRSQSRERSS
jgi:hypothetical protein